MTSYDVLRANILALFPEVMAAARNRAAETALDRLSRSADRLRSGQLNVVVCGEFKRGKSSLLNAC